MRGRARETVSGHRSRARRRSAHDATTDDETKPLASISQFVVVDMRRRWTSASACIVRRSRSIRRASRIRSASRASTSRVVSERASHATRVVTPSRRLCPARARQPRDGDRVDVDRRRTSFPRAFTAASRSRVATTPIGGARATIRTHRVTRAERSRAVDRRIDTRGLAAGTRPRARRRCRILARRARPDARALVVYVAIDRIAIDVDGVRAVEGLVRHARGGSGSLRDFAETNAWIRESWNRWGVGRGRRSRR